MNIKHITSKEFEAEVLNCKEPVLVDFFATWCGPCRMLAPVMEEVSEKCKVVKIDTDEEPDLAIKYGIMSIPCVILFKGGKEVSRIVGYHPATEFFNMINNN